MIVSGTFGAVFTEVAEAVPVVGVAVLAVAGAYEVYDKTAATADYAGEHLGDVVNEITSGQSLDAESRQVAQRWFDSVARAVESGRLRLRDGLTLGDLGTAWVNGGGANNDPGAAMAASEASSPMIRKIHRGSGRCASHRSATWATGLPR
jgi:hypothetical protein